MPAPQEDSDESRTETMTPAECAERLKAIADTDRLRIVSCLQMGALAVGDISELLEMDVVRTSHHLGVLRSQGIVLSEKQGRHRLYSLNPAFFRKSDVLRLDFGCCRLDLAPGWAVTRRPPSDGT